MVTNDNPNEVGAWLVPKEEAFATVSKVIQLLETLKTEPSSKDLRHFFEAAIRRFRELRFSIATGDRFWILKEERVHADSAGLANYLVIVRPGQPPEKHLISVL